MADKVARWGGKACELDGCFNPVTYTWYGGRFCYKCLVSGAANPATASDVGPPPPRYKVPEAVRALVSEVPPSSDADLYGDGLTLARAEQVVREQCVVPPARRRVLSARRVVTRSRAGRAEVWRIELACGHRVERSRWREAWGSTMCEVCPKDFAWLGERLIALMKAAAGGT